MPQLLTLDDLSHQERLLIWSLRVSYAPQISEQDTACALEESFRLAGIEPALSAFNGYINAVATCLISHQLAIHVHSPCCSNIGLDEWRIVQTLAALQSFDASLARSHLEALLPQDSAEHCCKMAAACANTFTHFDFRLPDPRQRSVTTTYHYDLNEVHRTNLSARLH